MPRIVIPAGAEQTVYYDDHGEWVAAPSAPDEVVEAGSLVLYGGHEYEVTDALLGAIVGAGFEVVVTDAEEDD